MNTRPDLITVGSLVTGTVTKIDGVEVTVTEKVAEIFISSRNEPFIVLEGMPGCEWLSERFKPATQK